MNDLIFFIFPFIILIYSVIVHEIAHGYMAEYLGDPTARLAGRLTLNPIPHIDPFGSVLLPLLLTVTGSPVLLGWAKPVPYNPFLLVKDPRYGPLKVALAGPISNIFLFIVFGLLARFGLGFLDPNMIMFFGMIALLNIYLAVFNLVPIPPLDGSQLLQFVLPPRTLFMLQSGGGGILLVFLFVFLFSGIISFVAGNLFFLVAGSGVAGML